MSQRPVTLTDIVAGHVSLDIEGFDRIYLNGYVPALQTGGQVAGFLHWRGFPIASPAALGKISQGFRAAVRRYADSNDIPWVVFRKGDRKLDVMRPYLDAAERAGQSEVVAIGEAREFQWVFDATRKEGPDGVPWFSREIMHADSRPARRSPLHPRTIAAGSEPGTEQPEQPGTEGTAQDSSGEHINERSKRS
jgi:hypothetical protein